MRRTLRHLQELRKTDLRHARELRKADKDLLKAVLVAMNTAVSKAETAAEKRADASNEIRQAMMDQQRTLMPRLESEAEQRARDEKFATLREGFLANRTRGAALDWGWEKLVAVGALALALWAIYQK